MINFDNLTSDEFALLGFAFETPEETELFASVIREELEVRVGQAVGKNFTSEQKKEFDSCTDLKESTLLLEKYCPNYREIVSAEKERLEDELLEYRAIIPGVVAVPPQRLSIMTVEDLFLSVHSLNCLKRAGLNTVGEIVRHGKLSQIKNLGQRGIDEINAKLWELRDIPIYDGDESFYDEDDLSLLIEDDD